jgi:hypothetical protein
MITKTLRLTILMVAMMTVLGTGGPVAAFATAYGGNEDSLADRITEDIDRIINEIFNDVDTQDLLDGVITELPTTLPPISSPNSLCFGRNPTIVGTSGDDTLYGTDGPDVISGLGEMITYWEKVDTTVSAEMKVMT